MSSPVRYNIGSQLRIRLPNDYVVRASDYEPLIDQSKSSYYDEIVPQLTLADFNRVVIKPMLDNLMTERNKYAVDILYGVLHHPGYRPVRLTRWQRLRRRWSDFLDRFPAAWGVVTGRLEARNPDDWEY